jgi:hypothetical protein
MKKLWQISGTKEFHENKIELKKIRTEMNKESGHDESDKEVNPNTWRYKIVKGPDHYKLQ